MSSPHTPPTTTADLLLHRFAQHVAQQPAKMALGWLSPHNTTTSNSAASSSGESSCAALEMSWTYRELDAITNQLARRLMTMKSDNGNESILSKGDRVMLVYPPSPHFMIAFLACCKAGIVAVPVFPPHPHRRQTLAMFSSIVQECNAQVALTSSAYQHQKQLAGIKDALLVFQKKKRELAGKWPEHLRWIVTDASSSNNNSIEDLPSNGDAKNALQTDIVTIQSSDLAFLQYTSGSTSSPKGVMVTHGNLAHNLTLITNELNAKQDTVVVSWLPQYHDMGLIGSYLGVLYCGGTGYYMSPLSFLQRPMIWMEAVSQYRATHLQGPNFCFKLIARKYFENPPQGQKQLDLSCIRHIINGAEPIDEDSMDAFAKAMAPFGYNEKVMFPTYGLAEHTVFVCSGGQQRLHVVKQELEEHSHVVTVAVDDRNKTTRTSKVVIGCGYPPAGVDVRIVHIETQEEVGPDSVGEIWIQSLSKAAGYFGKPNETLTDFHAQIINNNNNKDKISATADSPLSAITNTDHGYLRTGDLGFFHNHELFVCGRLKDLIILGGRNYYPQDLEATAEAAISESCRPGCSAAFTVDPTLQSGGEEEICLMMELRDALPTSGSKAVTRYSDTTYQSLAESVRSAISHEHSLSLSIVLFLKAKTVPKTSSGKIARAWCRKALSDQTLQILYKQSFKPSLTTTTTFEISSSPIQTSHQPFLKNKTEIRSMDRKDLLQQLAFEVSKLASLEPELIRVDVALTTMLDSLSLSQFKGLLQSHFAVSQLSDQYLFRDTTTLNKLVDVIRLGYAPDDDEISSQPCNPDTHNVASSTGDGITGALGCPPGVVCCNIV